MRSGSKSLIGILASPHGPDVENIGKIDNRSLSEIKKAALERAQQILKEKSSQYKP